jgi:hypothetical protein
LTTHSSIEYILTWQKHSDNKQSKVDNTQRVMERGLSKKSNILSVNVYIYIYCVVNIVVHSDTVLWCQPLIVCCLCVFVMLIYILYTAVCCQPLIVCCLSVFVRLICTLYSCVLSTFNCMLFLWFCHVYMYFMQMCDVNMWLYAVCVLLLCNTST